MILKMCIDTTDLADEIEMNNDITDIRELILEIDKLLENEEFTKDLIKELIDSLGVDVKTIKYIMTIIDASEEGK